MKKCFLFFLLLSFEIFATESPSWKENLVNKAREARENAYCPYSNYAVGAAVLAEDGSIYTGINVENASYGLTICAERSAIFSAVTAGKKNLKAIAIVTKDGGSPCGACRQVINEFNPGMTLLIGSEKGSFVKELNLSALLTDAFGPKNLQNTSTNKTVADTQLKK